jgi:hypothetical protein
MTLKYIEQLLHLVIVYFFMQTLIVYINDVDKFYKA